MSTPTIDGITLLHRRIQGALAALRGARDVYAHCPSIENWAVVQAGERHLDTLLADKRIPRGQDGAT